MSRSFRHRQALLLMVLAAAQYPRPALAVEPGSPAYVLFEEGRKQVEQGDYRGACPKFEQSLRLEVGLGTQFNLADCWEHIGKNASARALFLGAAASAKAAGQTEREQVLRERAQALELRVARLVIEVQGAAPRLTIKRNDLPIDETDWGRAVAVDPDTYRISAWAPGKLAWSKTLRIEPTSKVVTVEVPALESAVEPEASGLMPKPARAVRLELPAERRGDPRATSYAPLILGAIGVGALASGAVLGLEYLSANSDAKEICPSGDQCSEVDVAEHARLLNEAKSARIWSYAGFGVGAFALGGAAAVYLLDRAEARHSRTGLRAAPLVAAGSFGAVVGSSF